jgi:hypothetical protein
MHGQQWRLCALRYIGALKVDSNSEQADGQHNATSEAATCGPGDVASGDRMAGEASAQQNPRGGNGVARDQLQADSRLDIDRTA